MKIKKLTKKEIAVIAGGCGKGEKKDRFSCGSVDTRSLIK
jgi:hypothetical protein